MVKILQSYRKIRFIRQEIDTIFEGVNDFVY